MIRSTHASSPDYVVSAYSDNAAVVLGSEGSFLSPSHISGEYNVVAEPVYNVIKVETVSNHQDPSSFPRFVNKPAEIIMTDHCKQPRIYGCRKVQDQKS